MVREGSAFTEPARFGILVHRVEESIVCGHELRRREEVGRGEVVSPRPRKEASTYAHHQGKAVKGVALRVVELHVSEPQGGTEIPNAEHVRAFHGSGGSAAHGVGVGSQKDGDRIRGRAPWSAPTGVNIPLSDGIPAGVMLRREVPPDARLKVVLER